MKLYAYSNELIELVDAKWITIKFALLGILVGSIVFFTVLKLNHSSEKIFRSHLANTFETENYILQEQVNQLTPQVYSLKMQTAHLIVRSGKLDKLLFRSMINSETDSGFNVKAKTFRFQSSLFASVGSQP